MRTRTPSQLILILCILASLLACGGGGGSAPAPAPGGGGGGGGGPAPAPAPNVAGRGAFCQTSLSPARNAARDGIDDPLMSTQWYLGGLNIDDAWAAGHDGTDIQIGIIDGGIEIAHEDLRGNVEDGASINFVSFAQTGVDGDNPIPTTCDRGGAHGTAVAGIIAAEGDNGLGIKGIAYNSKIFGTNFIGDQSDANLMRSLTQEMTDTAISVNSWGPEEATRIRSTRNWDAIRMAVEDGVRTGFDGKGISFVFSGGNSGDLVNNGLGGITYVPDPPAATHIDLATYERHLNQPQIIPVCSVGSDNVVARYSTAGANLWICGAAGTGANFMTLEEVGIPTLDLTGASGYNNGTPPAECNTMGLRDCWEFGGSGSSVATHLPAPPTTSNPGNYQRFFTGTSAAAPVVSGVIALMRDANPDLTWRDVKLILAESAVQVSPGDTTDRISDIGWQDVGSALGTPANSYTHHHDYGFGLVDALTAVTLAAPGTWTLVPDLTANPTNVSETYVSATGITNFTVTAANDEGITFIEYVQVDVQSDHPNFGDLAIELLSPHGTRSLLAFPHGCLRYTDLGSATIARPTNTCADLSDEFTFGSAAHLGETPIGEWALGIIRANGSPIPAGTGTPTALTLRIFGHTRPSP